MMLDRILFATGLLLTLLALLWGQMEGAVDTAVAPLDLSDIDAYVQEQMQRSSIPGLAYAIVAEGQIAHMQAFGVADPNGRPMTVQTPLYIGSVGKTFTALATRQLVNAGRLDLDAPVTGYLPWFRVANTDTTEQITVRHLLMHTSGFSNLDGNDPALYDPALTGEALVRRLATFRLNRSVGASYEYSNINYLVLGQVIEAATGMSYARYVREQIFDPLEMRHSFLLEEAARQNGLSSGYRYYFGRPMAVDVREPMGAIASGFHIACTEDMAHYLIAFTEHGRYNDISLVNPDGELETEDQQRYYNIDWVDLRETEPHGNTEVHSGGWLNYSAGLAFMPYEKIGVVVLANSYPAQWLDVKDAFAIAMDVLRLYTGNPPNPAKPALITLYLIADAVLLAFVALVVWRWTSVRGWRQRAPRAHRRPRSLVLFVLLDWLLPLYLLLIWPVVQLASPGNINYRPWWNWNRLAFSVPDVTGALFLLAVALLGVGVTKLWILMLFHKTDINFSGKARAFAQRQSRRFLA